MSASLVGSEMCIRDRGCCELPVQTPSAPAAMRSGEAPTAAESVRELRRSCLLYTSDAADDM
eukprot:8714824-Alexandrium_andersonii.AAC.1